MTPCNIKRLAPAEKRVLPLLLNGYTDKEIANLLDKAVRTIKFYKSAIFFKFNVHSRGELIRKLGHFEVQIKWVWRR